MVEGGCLCGAIRIKSTGKVTAKARAEFTCTLQPHFSQLLTPFQALCHCLDCRKITGSTFSTNVVVPSDSFSVTKGTPKEFAKKADSGEMVKMFFCGDCGSTIWSQSLTYGDTRVIKAGTLDSDGALEDAKPVLELFVRNRPSWIPAMSGAEQHKGA